MTKSLFHVRMKYTRSIEEAKEMKKWLAVFTCGLLLSAGVCMSQAEGAGKDTLYEKGKEIEELVIDAVRSEDYVNLYSASEDVSNLLKEVGTAEWAEPEAVYEVTVSDAFYKTLDEAGALNNLSEELAKIVKSKLFTSMVYQISGYSSSVELAAASVCSAGKTFLAPEITENNICIYTYDDGKPIAVTFILGDDGTVSANGIIILNDDFQHDSVEEIEEAFADFQAEVTQIK